MGVHSSENVSPHSVAYKSPRREHTVQQCFVKRQQYYLSRPRPSNPLRIVVTLLPPLPARSVPHFLTKINSLTFPRGHEQRDFIHLQECPPRGMPRGQSCLELTGTGVKSKTTRGGAKGTLSNHSTLAQGEDRKESSGISYRDSKYFRKIYIVSSSFELTISPPKRLFTE